MEKHPFIFSDERKYRIMRHLAFWTFWWLFQGFLYAFTPAIYGATFKARLSMSIIESVIYLLPHMFLAYSLMYFIIPHFLLKQRYWHTVISITVAFLFTGICSIAVGRFLIDPLHIIFYGKEFVTVTALTAKTFFLSLMAGLRGGITIGGLAASIKLMKYWYVKEQRNMYLQNENLESQLQLLKAQVHPHFLFNTLNNLYSLTLTHSNKAPVVVTHLADLLRYMLYECDEKEVPLEKEIEVLKKYVELEKIRYGDRIDVSFSCGGDLKENKIAPLILLPFIENSFKYSVSEQVDQCWVNLHLHANGNEFTFNLSNSSAGDKPKSAAGGIGLQNIKKRLELIYPGKYNLTINEEAEMYVVKLKMQLNHVAEQVANPPSVMHKTPATI